MSRPAGLDPWSVVGADPWSWRSWARSGPRRHHAPGDQAQLPCTETPLSSSRAATIVRQGQYGTSTFVQDRSLAREFLLSLRDAYPRYSRLDATSPQTQLDATRIVIQAALGEGRRSARKREPTTDSGKHSMSPPATQGLADLAALEKPLRSSSADAQFAHQVHDLEVLIDKLVEDRLRLLAPVLRAQTRESLIPNSNNHQARGLVSNEQLFLANAARHLAFDQSELLSKIPMGVMKKLQRGGHQLVKEEAMHGAPPGHSGRPAMPSDHALASSTSCSSAAEIQSILPQIMDDAMRKFNFVGGPDKRAAKLADAVFEPC